MIKTTVKTKNTQNVRKRVSPVAREGFLVRRRRVVVLLVIAVLGVAGILYYRHHQAEVRTEKMFEADKARFAKIEADMKKAHAAILESVGKPAEEKWEKSCFHKSAKYGLGDLICRVSLKQIYEGIDDGEYIESFMSISSSTELVRDLDISDGTTIKEYYLDTLEEAQCSVQLTYKVGVGTEADYSCSDNLKRAIYPLAE